MRRGQETRGHRSPRSEGPAPTAARVRGAGWRPPAARVPGAAALALLAALAALPAGGRAQGAGGDAAGGAVGPGVRVVTLEEARRIAARSNPALARSRARVDAARAGRLRAAGAFLPGVSLGYDVDRTSTGRVDATGQTFTSTNNAARITGSLELFSGLRRFRQLESSRRDVAAGRARVRESRFDALLDVERAFLDAVAARELAAVQEDRVERQQNQLAFVRQRVARGKSTHSDSLRSRVDLNDARVALIRARNDVRAATFALARAMGVRGRALPEAGAGLDAGPLPFDRRELARIAVASSPALEAAEADARAAEARSGAARSSWLPTVSLSGGWDWRAESFPPDRASWSVSLSASYPLFDGFDREAGIRRADSEARVAEARRLEEELAVRAGIDDACSQIEAARATVRLAEESVALSREDLRVSRERYRLGLATIVDLQTAENGLADAEANLIRRRFEHRLGLARLEALVGRELDDPGLEALVGRADDDAPAGNGGDEGGEER